MSVGGNPVDTRETAVLRHGGGEQPDAALRVAEGQADLCEVEDARLVGAGSANVSILSVVCVAPGVSR